MEYTCSITPVMNFRRKKKISTSLRTLDHCTTHRIISVSAAWNIYMNRKDRNNSGGMVEGYAVRTEIDRDGESGGAW